MKRIKEFRIWKDGQEPNVSLLKVSLIHDNLEDEAEFAFEIITNEFEVKDENGTRVIEAVASSGKIKISGNDYSFWGVSKDINEEAYKIVASKLNLSLL